jgi:hypothetical protein
MNKHEQLLQNIKKDLPALEGILEEVSDMWNYEDVIYRFYHRSFKTYYVQTLTRRIFQALEKLAPKDTDINQMVLQIIKDGNVGEFKRTHNRQWEKKTRPQLEAFLHMKYFLEMAVKYGKELKQAPQILPSGWAGLLYFYNIRYSN